MRARIAGAGGSLSEAQRRIADLVATDPEAVAFGTVRSVAAATRTSDPTVVSATVETVATRRPAIITGSASGSSIFVSCDVRP